MPATEHTSPAATASGSTAGATITEPMRDRLPGRLVARLVIREEVVRVLRAFRDGFDEHEKREVDVAALDHAEAALATTVDKCRSVLAGMGVNS